MTDKRKQAPPFSTIWRLGSDMASRRELLALWAERYKLPSRKWWRKLTNRKAPSIEMRLVNSHGTLPTSVILRRKDGGDHASFFENFFEVPYRFARFAPVQLAVDAGAHVGFFSLALHRAFPEAEIVAFEPSQENVEVLRQNWSANSMAGQVVDKALWIEETVLEFQLGKSNSGRIQTSSSQSDEEALASRLDRVERIGATTLQAVLGERLGELDLLKLDIEGAEMDVLDVLLPDLTSRTTILCELHFDARNRSRFEDILARHGWNGEIFDDDHPPHSGWIIQKGPSAAEVTS